MSSNNRTPIPWAERGWAASPEYYAFWSTIFSADLAPYLNGRIIADVGSGNGRILEQAMHKGLAPRQLHLIDPDLRASDTLEALDFVHCHACGLQNLADLTVQTAVFKQSFHLIYPAMGARLFEKLRADTYIVLRMPEDVDWPLSEATRTWLRASCFDIRQYFTSIGGRLVSSRAFSFPVRMTRSEWVDLLWGRFVTCLHHADDRTIFREASWAERHLPETLHFDDLLQCLIIAFPG